MRTLMALPEPLASKVSFPGYIEPPFEMLMSRLLSSFLLFLIIALAKGAVTEPRAMYSMFIVNT
jgi:hypothetical protein